MNARYKTPSIETALNVYEVAARTERVKTGGKPCERTEKTVIATTRLIARTLGIKESASIDTLTRKALTEFAVKQIENNVSRLSVLTYFEKLKSLGAKWTEDYYADRKLKTPKFSAPVIHCQPKRYRRPSEKTRKAVLKWYQSLDCEYDDLKWGIVTMMIEFAMRNGDIGRLTWGNFKETESGTILEYVPHKTSLSSARRVVANVPLEIWDRLRNLKDKDGVNDDTPVFKRLGVSRVMPEIARQMRSFGFTGSKSTYELRKLCIDTTYRHFGAEAASAISGDDIRTVTKYYADSSICNFGNVRISELMAKGARQCA